MKLNLYAPILQLALATVLINPVLSDDPPKKDDKPKLDCKMNATDRKDKFKLAADPGCTDPTKPARCQSGNLNNLSAPANCVEDYTKCVPSSGCGTKNNLRCTTGECVEHIAFCPYDVHNQTSLEIVCPNVNGTEMERCPDGICRPKDHCKCVGMSGCPFGMTQCPDSSCKSSIGDCIAAVGCPLNTPWDCGWGACETNWQNCADNMTVQAFSSKVVEFDGSKLDDIKKKASKLISIRSAVSHKMSMNLKYSLDVFDPPVIGASYTVKRPLKPVWNRQQWQAENKNNNADDKKRRLQPPVNPPAGNTDEYKPERPKFLPAQFDKFKDKMAHDLIPPNEIPQASIDNNFVLNKLTGKASLTIDFVPMTEIADTKIRFAAQDLMVLEGIFGLHLEPDPKDPHHIYYPLHAGVISAPVKFTTKGRFNDEADFNMHCQFDVTFAINNSIMSPRYNLNLSEYQRIRIFSKLFCLGYANPDTKLWTCANRLPSDIDFPDDKSGKNGNGTVSYRVPWPGTFAIIVMPVSDLFTLATSGAGIQGEPNLKGATYEGDNYQIYIFLIVIFLMIFLFWVRDVASNVKLSELNHKCSAYKYSIVRSTTIDYSGQGVLRKLDETVRFFENPQLSANEEETDELNQVNQELDEENAILMSNEAENSKISKQNRQLRDETKRLAKMNKNVAVNKQYEQEKNLAYKTYNFTRSPWATLEGKKLKLIGKSLYGHESMLKVDWTRDVNNNQEDDENEDDVE